MHGIYGFRTGQVACLPWRRVLALRGNSIPITPAHLGCTWPGCEGTGGQPVSLGTLVQKGQVCSELLLLHLAAKPLLLTVSQERGAISFALLFFYSCLLLARFAVKSGGREGTDFPRALWIVLLFMPVQSGHQVRGLVLADKVFSAGPELVSAVSKVLAPHPVTKVQCI